MDTSQFLTKIDIRGEDDCWLWQGGKTKGYGVANVDGFKTKRAHRIAYELLQSPIPDKLVLDHVCHTKDLLCRKGDNCQHRACCNPSHLEPVTLQENLHRAHAKEKQTHCKRGHEFTLYNTYGVTASHRQCRICNINRAQKWRDQKKENEKKIT